MIEQTEPTPVLRVPQHSTKDIWLIVFVITYNFGLLIFSALWIFTNSFLSFKSGLKNLPGLELNESVTYGLFFSGVLGGSFYCLRAVYLRLSAAYPETDPKPAPEKVFNIRVWLFWYVFRPWQGGVLALIIMCLVNGSLLTAKAMTPESMKSFYTLIAVGFLAGLGSNEVIQKIQEIIAVVFAKSKAGEHPAGK